MSKILGFIPARCGSKRLPNKNVKEFAGKPLIAWTIEAALNADIGMDVVVSTDCVEIASIAEAAGAEVPFLRPSFLATDTASSADVLRHTLEEFARQGREYEYIMFLQPTSPLRQKFHIEDVVSYLDKKNGDCVISVSTVEHPLEWMMELPSSFSMEDFIGHNLPLLKERSQDLPKRYQVNGAIYFGKTSYFLKENSFYLEKGKVFAYVMENKYSIDIDDMIDFQYAEFLQLKT